MNGPWKTVRSFASLVRLAHTIFGLPFALASAALAHRYALEHGREGLTIAGLGWILVAFTSARAAAMGFNRIIDRTFDAANPRTRDREIPAGVISVRAAAIMSGLSAAAFWASAWALSPLAGVLAPLCLAIVLGYSFFKRFSWTSHLFLGVALALAPGGAWIAVTGSWDGWTIPFCLMVAVASWVAGFDVLYSLADEAFDRTHGLHSIPARFGRVGALVISASLHVVTVAALLVLDRHAALGGWHLLGVGSVAAILVYEHAIVRPDDLSRLNKAFFDLNGYVSLVYLGCALATVFG
jgi:4-hydroxybenzoate polyprenyltransferase